MIRISGSIGRNGFILFSHQIVTECDKRVQQMKQIEELVCLKKMLDFGKVKVTALFVPRVRFIT